jgi:hypothetical protein
MNRKVFEDTISRFIGARNWEMLASARRVYADWLEEQGTPKDQELAEAQRWMADNDKSPYRSRSAHYSRPSWDWWRTRGEENDKTLGSRHARISGELLARIEFRRGSEGSRDFKEFSTRQAAERALAKALVELKVEEKQKEAVT